MEKMGIDMRERKGLKVVIVTRLESRARNNFVLAK
jgi:hypothetical protein